MTHAHRIRGAGAASLVIAVVLAGCGSDDEGEAAEGGGDSQTLSILTPAAEGTPGGDVFHAVVEEFEKETGIEVELQVVGEDVPLVFETSVAAGQQADIVHINPVGPTLLWIDNDVTIDVTEYLDEWGLGDRVLPEAIEIWSTPDGRLQGFPFEGFQWPVWYNTAALDRAGVEIPTTTDDLVEVAAALRAAGIQPFSTGGNDWSGEKLFYQIAESYLPREEALDIYLEGGWCESDEAVRGIELFVELRDAGVFIDDVEGLEATTMTASFFDGTAAIMSAGSWSFAEVPAEMMDDIVLGGLPLPADAAYSTPTAYQGVANGFFVSTKGAEKLDTVRAFIEYLYQPEVPARFIDEAQVLSALEVDPALIDTDANPLLAQAVTLPDTVEYAINPDVPGDLQSILMRETALAYGPDRDAAQICAGLDAVYAGR